MCTIENSETVNFMLYELSVNKNIIINLTQKQNILGLQDPGIVTGEPVLLQCHWPALSCVLERNPVPTQGKQSLTD